ncbi:hypothetical protein BDK51DRAFT_48967 [Blyttiomyces helicus]|uniref:Uncharacterized protein n=1 Tax=Blyttiomyces helicus TaxID=388810 RepID=A0A4P9W1B0_9FUNG|nr:hypothetical protein BDK51DRAFT_48967 [Blyttiomyces helicus]|eukprot:RKO84498.1 hypothetical protein BDK51DRAFT_48967 [Blyttiomyces helicus]
MRFRTARGERAVVSPPIKHSTRPHRPPNLPTSRICLPINVRNRPRKPHRKRHRPRNQPPPKPLDARPNPKCQPHSNRHADRIPLKYPHPEGLQRVALRYIFEGEWVDDLVIFCFIGTVVWMQFPGDPKSAALNWGDLCNPVAEGATTDRKASILVADSMRRTKTNGRKPLRGPAGPGRCRGPGPLCQRPGTASLYGRTGSGRSPMAATGGLCRLLPRLLAGVSSWASLRSPTQASGLTDGTARCRRSPVGSQSGWWARTLSGINA